MSKLKGLVLTIILLVILSIIFLMTHFFLNNQLETTPQQIQIDTPPKVENVTTKKQEHCTFELPDSAEQGNILFLDPTTQQPVAVEGLNYRLTETGLLKKLSSSSCYLDQKTTKDGGFQFRKKDKLSLQIGSQYFHLGFIPKQVILQDLISNDKNILINFNRLLLSLDTDNNSTTGIQLPEYLSELDIDLLASSDIFEKQLAKALLKYEKAPIALFQPSLGINVESPQPEADSVGQAIAFVDLFRTARPFYEHSCTNVSYDQNGWPTSIPEICQPNTNPNKDDYLKIPLSSEEGNAGYARTFLLLSMPKDSIPMGTYTIMYEGEGDMEYSGGIKNIQRNIATGINTFEIDETSPISRIKLKITRTNPDNHIRNIRVVMPGGICQNNPLVHVQEESNCPESQYLSFADLLSQDRNTIVFNPDYLMFLKDFRVIRLMNFMLASPRLPRSCKDADDPVVCLTETLTWEQRPSMDKASWGVSYRSDIKKWSGVPLEVAVELANQTNAHPWFNIPHHADDNYVREYATYVKHNLDPNLIPHIEYSNEVWNAGFWGSKYSELKGKALGLENLEPKNRYRDDNYHARYRYYSKRSVEIFRIWEEVFNATDRIIRIVSTYQADALLSKDILSYEQAFRHIDAIAMAPYYRGCWDRAHEWCANKEKVDLTFMESDSLDDIFQITEHQYYPETPNDPGDPHAIPSIIHMIKKQAKVAKEYGVDLYAYEGGQHLTVPWGDENSTEEQRNQQFARFEAMNRDKRISQQYIDLLTSWKKAGGKQFMLFTMPQTFHHWGAFGIKESLNQPRNTAPKYDAIMDFQEQQKQCWWNNC